VTTFAESRQVWRGLGSESWGTERIFVGGKDRTNWWGAPTETAGYQLTEPYGYGPADFRFPKIGVAAQTGSGDLSWLYRGAPVRLVQYGPDGTRVRTVWRGFIDKIGRGKTDTSISCLGDLSGRMSYRDKQAELVYWTKDAGLLVADIIRKAGKRPFPPLGPKTGIMLPERGRDGGTFLDYCDRILSESQRLDGKQLTVMPDDRGRYQIGWKDRDTVNATLFADVDGVEVDLSQDLADRTSDWYGYGRRPAGGPRGGELWRNSRYPGLFDADVPFPGALTLGDSGDNVDILQAQMTTMGYLDRADSFGDTFDADTAKAVRKLQKSSGLAVTGTVNEATWNALFDVDVKDLSLRGAFIEPLVWDERGMARFHTATGAQLGHNPAFDPNFIRVDRTVDFGVMKQGRAEDWCEAQADKLAEREVWYGTLTLTTDAWSGDIAYEDTVGDGTAVGISRRDIEPGWNIRLGHFNGDNVLLHVSGVDVSGDGSVRLAVDSHARDLLELGAIIQRRREGRENPHRNWIQSRRRGSGPGALVESDEKFGWLFQPVHLAANDWTVFPVLAGQSGSVNKLRVVLPVDGEFVVAITARERRARWWNRRVPNPFGVVARLTQLHVTATGSGYTSAPTVSITGGGGSGASAVAEVSDGKVIGLSWTSRGSGYTSAPDLSLTGGGGSGASGQVGFGVTGSDNWTTEKVRQAIEDDAILLGAWGDHDQPGGYFPGVKSEGDPKTGRLVDAGGFDYWTFGRPVLWVAVYSKVATTLRNQRILWPVTDSNT
jgi:hypothetical protein